MTGQEDAIFDYRRLFNRGDHMDMFDYTL
jgi:hypothetical protein